MKVTGGVDQAAPGHWRNQFDQCPVVRLNDVVVDHVCEADDVAGYVVVVCYDADDKLVLDETGQAIKTERLEGKVEIIAPLSNGAV